MPTTLATHQGTALPGSSQVWDRYITEKQASLLAHLSSNRSAKLEEVVSLLLQSVSQTVITRHHHHLCLQVSLNRPANQNCAQTCNCCKPVAKIWTPNHCEHWTIFSRRRIPKSFSMESPLWPDHMSSLTTISKVKVLSFTFSTPPFLSSFEALCLSTNSRILWQLQCRRAEFPQQDL